MIYLDNAATTIHKPPCVVQAVTEALCSLGNSGRGSHEGALGASRLIYETRSAAARLFGGEEPSSIVFTMNATESLNIALRGVLEPGDHVISTVLEHNSVLRPLYELERQGVELSFVSCDSLGRLIYEEMEHLIRENTRAVVCTHGSNLTGNVVNIQWMGELARKHGLLFIVDCAQTAGVIPVDVKKYGIDLLCFTGHKGLHGPQGTGGLYVRPGVEVRPLLSGGSGVQTFSRSHPAEMPTRLEAGTMNAHGLAGLRAALGWLDEVGIDTIRHREQELMWTFYRAVRDIPGVTVYGDFSVLERCPILSLNLWDWDSALVSDVLFRKYGIAARPGGHCAPLIHQALGIKEQGAVRFSFSWGNTKEEVEIAAAAIRALAEV